MSVADAVSRQKNAPSKERIYQEMLGNYILATSYDHVLPQSASATPISSRPSSASGTAAPVASPSDMNVSKRPSSIIDLIADGTSQTNPTGYTASLNAAGANSATHKRKGSNQSGMTNTDAAVGRPPAVRVVRERETPVFPGIHDPVLFHTGIQKALVSVLRHSAGYDCPEGFIRSCNHPSASDSADTVTVRFCPNKSKNPLRVSNIPLRSCIVKLGQPGYEKALYVPETFDFSMWTSARSDKAQQLYNLLERLHVLFEPGLASVNLYYDADDGFIAFNQGNKLWYNAHADHTYEQSPQGVRLFDWYITVCHELAHNFQHEHNEVFSDYLAHIALQHSRAFYNLCSESLIPI